MFAVSFVMEETRMDSHDSLKQMLQHKSRSLQPVRHNWDSSIANEMLIQLFI
jgi:hypothetical protein